VIELNQEFIPWIVEQYNGGAEVASLCIGSFFLAATGLLKGKKCATHWRFANEFRALYPDVDLVDEKITTDDDGIYTSGGAYAYLNLLVYLIEKYAGRQIAILIAKAFMIDIDRTLQSPFIIFQGQKSHEDDTVKKAQEYFPVVSLQNKYSIVVRDWEPELQFCKENDIAFIPWNPINAGNISFLQKLDEVAERHHATAQQVALSWLYHHEPNILLIPGTSKLSHAEENIKAADLLLTPEEMDELESVSA